MQHPYPNPLCCPRSISCLLLLLLLSHFSRVQHCATPQTPPSLGFSRQEHWSGLPFPSPTDQPPSISLKSQKFLFLYTRRCLLCCSHLLKIDFRRFWFCYLSCIFLYLKNGEFIEVFVIQKQRRTYIFLKY